MAEEVTEGLTNKGGRITWPSGHTESIVDAATTRPPTH
jgi:hypothetical protein